MLTTCCSDWTITVSNTPLNKEVEEVEEILAELWVNVFYCETCDKNFKSLEELMEHTTAKKHTGTGLYR